MLYIGNNRYRVYSGRDRVSIESPKKLDVIKNTLLPPGLELYDYIESSGTLWIDTEVICNNGISTYLDFQCTVGHSNYSKIMGYAVSTSWTPYGFGTGIGTNGAFSRWGNGTLTMSSTTFTTNRVNVTFLSNSTSNNGNIAIFDIAGSSGANYPRLYMKVFLCRITNSNNLLVRNMLPCTYFGEPGMWDTVENKFYGNSGDGEFILGNKIILREYEYLKGNGNAYIDTLYYPNVNTKLILKRSNPETGSINDGEINGSSDSGGNFYIAETLYAFDNSKINMTSMRNTTPYIILIDINGLYINNTFIARLTSYETNWISPRTFYLFGLNRGNTYTSNCNTIYYCLLYDNGTLVRDYVPCSYNGTPGLWDKIELKFYGSSNNGTFIVGNEIKCYNTLIGDGNAYIETNFIPTKNTEIKLKFSELQNNSSTYYPIIHASGTGIELFTKANTNYAAYNGTAEKLFTGPDSSLEHIEVILKHNYFEANGIVYINTSINENLNPTKSLPIFGAKNSSNAMDSRKGSHRLYYLKIYDNCVLIRDFVPCLYNREAGLWDSVERKFYGNANSAGLLIVRNDS